MENLLPSSWWVSNKLPSSYQSLFPSLVEWQAVGTQDSNSDSLRAGLDWWQAMASTEVLCSTLGLKSVQLASPHHSQHSPSAVVNVTPHCAQALGTQGPCVEIYQETDDAKQPP